MRADVLERLERLLHAARRIADPGTDLGREARARLSASTRLSPEGVAAAIERCLEHHPTRAELEALASAVAPAPRVHVLLSSTVFTAAHRAIALGLAASDRVVVRPSRRDPLFSELLLRGAPGLFELSATLSPCAGEHVHAYATAETLAELRRTLPAGVVLHAHGPGFGVIVVGDADPASVASAVALDVALFDQRGCLSPRAVVVEGDPARARAHALALAEALAAMERGLPRGALDDEEQAEIVRYRDTMSYAGEVFPAGSGVVALAREGAPLFIAPVGRNLHVVPTGDAAALLAPHAHAITTVAVAGSPALTARVHAALPQARRAELGRMQTPAFDGPVDRRTPPQGEMVG